jgi:hypothetical protein
MHRPKERKKSGKYPLKKILAYGAIAVLFLGVGLYFTLDYLNQTASSNSNIESLPKAAIVDHLSLSQPNETFIEESTALLNEAGFLVDYFEGESVTVEFYRNLPKYDYKLVILRVHSASYASYTPEQRVLDFFTSEPYSTSKYVGEQLNDRIRRVAFAPYEKGDPAYFGITSKFVRSSMKGEFNNAMVMMMGCDGLKYDDMAEAFVEKGAEVYVGWNRLVSAPHTDQITIDLLRRFLIEEQTIEEAIAGAMNKLGADPKYESVLAHYPTEGGNSTVREILSK